MIDYPPFVCVELQTAIILERRAVFCRNTPGSNVREVSRSGVATGLQNCCTINFKARRYRHYGHNLLLVLLPPIPRKVSMESIDITDYRLSGSLQAMTSPYASPPNPGILHLLSLTKSLLCILQFPAIVWIVCVALLTPMILESRSLVL